MNLRTAFPPSLHQVAAAPTIPATRDNDDPTATIRARRLATAIITAVMGFVIILAVASFAI